MRYQLGADLDYPRGSQFERLKVKSTSVREGPSMIGQLDIGQTNTNLGIYCWFRDHYAFYSNPRAFYPSPRAFYPSPRDFYPSPRDFHPNPRDFHLNPRDRSYSRINWRYSPPK